MAHVRKRQIFSLIEDSLRWSPAVGVYGLRQVGKTTLVESLALEQNAFFETFDQAAVLLAAENRPREFCDRKKLLCIDEVQKGPWVFPVIKDLIGTKRKPGRFLLTGSVRFTLKKEIRDALTGRLLLFELLPFTISETHHLPVSQFLKDIFIFLQKQRKKFVYDEVLAVIQKNFLARKIAPHHVAQHAFLGGMPVACFTRDADKRKRWYHDYFETLITRDVALVDSTLSGLVYVQGISFLRALSQKHGQEVKIAELAQKSALSVGLAKKLLMALHALCLIDFVVPEAHARQSVRKMRIEWKDVGLWGHFQNISPEGLKEDVTVLSVMLSHEFRSQMSVMSQTLNWTYYKSHNGAYIPWIFRQGNFCVACLYLPTEAPQPYQYRALKQFLKKETHGVGIILGAEKAPFLQLDEKILLMPARAIF